MFGACSTHGEMRNAYKLYLKSLKGKRPPGRPMRRWEDNIKIDLWETGRKDVDWIHLA
jgi:hypothetical protein